MKSVTKILPGWYLLKYDYWKSDNDTDVYANICLYRFRPKPTSELGSRLANLIYKQFSKKKIPTITLPTPLSRIGMKSKKHYPIFNK